MKRPRSTPMPRALGLALALVAFAFASGLTREASAFTHVVAEGETLAQIAIRVYGTPRFESAIASANALDVHGGSVIVPGQPLEIPAPSHYRVVGGETWPDLARTFLGDRKRADVLARANHAVSWVPPSVGQEIEIPAVIAHIAGDGDTMAMLAHRYFGNMNRAWELDAYNHRKGEQKLLRGEVVLVPLPDLSLTAEGKREAERAAERTRTEGGGQAFESQRRGEAELPPLLADVRAGRYVDAVARGNRLLGAGALTKPQLAVVSRALLEAYVALEAPGLAAAACDSLRANAPEVRFDPRTTSPKILAVCGAR